MSKYIKILTGLLIMLTAFSSHAQTFSVSTDSVYCVREFGGLLPDTAGTINLLNLTSNPIQLKVEVIYEDLSPNFAQVFYNGQIRMSNFLFDTDSTTVPGSSSIDFFAEFIMPGTLPLNKFKVLVYDQNDSLNSSQILTFASINCPHPSAQVIIDPLAQYCFGDSAFISASTNYSNYLWFNGDTSQTIYELVDNPITIEANDSVGCIVRDTLDLNVTLPYNESICIVSVDSATQKNIVVWEKTAGVRTEQFYVYKESFVAGVYNLIGFVPYDSLSVFIDNTSTPLQQAESYKISAIDSCGNESLLSGKHKTIHLTANVGVGGEHNLVWDGYEGFIFSSYNILRGPDPANMSVLTTVANTLFTYSDLTPLTGTNHYQIEAINSVGCTPTQKTTTYLSSVSNGVTINPIGIAENEDNNSVSIHPNPTKGLLTINLEYIPKSIALHVKDLLGRKVLTSRLQPIQQIQVNLADQEDGIYIVELILDDYKVVAKKVVKN